MSNSTRSDWGTFSGPLGAGDLPCGQLRCIWLPRCFHSLPASPPALWVTPLLMLPPYSAQLPRYWRLPAQPTLLEVTPVKGSFYLQRGHDPQGENCYSTGKFLFLPVLFSTAQSSWSLAQGTLPSFRAPGNAMRPPVLNNGICPIQENW